MFLYGQTSKWAINPLGALENNKQFSGVRTHARRL